MQGAQIIKQRLAAIEGNDYGNYQSLLGDYDYNLFKLTIQQIPKDPFAPPHTGIYRILLDRRDKRIVKLSVNSKIQNIALADFLARNFYKAAKRIAGGILGTGYSGIITIDEPGQVILDRNSVLISDDIIEVRCFVGLPAEGRIIKARIAENMLLDELPAIVKQALCDENMDYPALEKHVMVMEDAEFIRSWLDLHGLIAFVADGAVLPRESGTSDRPLHPDKAVPFKSPESLAFEVDLPHSGKIKGMAVPAGITLITGGGYHGKSTLLAALEAGIYNHIPGDGREQCITTPKAVKVRAYSGRYVVKTDISSFISNLPFDKETTSFSSDNASGSTSQAASIIEAAEAGATALFMDEDTCATNFMIRDRKMQQLVNKEDEPITTFIDKVQQIYKQKGISTVLVLGGVGDYFDVSDLVIQMKAYRPADVTQMAHRIAENNPLKRQREEDTADFRIMERMPVADSVNPENRYGKFSIYAREVRRINFGEQLIDLTDLEQLLELSQTKALAYAMFYSKKYMDGRYTMRQLAEQVQKDMSEHGIDIISDKISGHFAWFRGIEFIFALNRLRGFDVR